MGVDTCCGYVRYVLGGRADGEEGQEREEELR